MSKNQSNERKSKPAPFVQMPNYVQDSESYVSVGSSAKEILWSVLRQYKGNNNGNLLITWEAYRHVLAIKSQETFRKALKELIDNNLLVITGTGTTRHKRGQPPYLYALTWLTIDVVPLGGGVKSRGHSRAPPRSKWEPSEHSKACLAELGVK